MTEMNIIDRANVEIEISGIEIVALKKLSLVSHALASKFSGGAGREQTCLAGVLDDVIRRIDLSLAARPMTDALVEAVARAIRNVCDPSEKHAFHNGYWLDHARLAIAKIEAQGFVVVPVEPMPEMIGAWYRVKNGFHFADDPTPTDTSDCAAYRAMLAARPNGEDVG